MLDRPNPNVLYSKIACTILWGYIRVLKLRASLVNVYSMPLKCVLLHLRYSVSVAIFLDQDKSKVTGWEMIFILFAGAFTLEEYTAATEHGWISKTYLSFLTLLMY